MMLFDLDHLKLFALVARHSSITRAAAKAHLSLSAASERMRTLEDAFGIRLLERKARGVKLTPAGEALLPHVEAVLVELDRMHAAMRGYTEGGKGLVRLLCNTAAMSGLVPGAVAGFLAAHPEADVELEERSSAQIVKEILAGTAEVGVLSDAVAHAGLSTFPLATDTTVAISAKGKLPRGPILLESLAGERFVALRKDSVFQQHVEASAKQDGTRLDIRARVADFEALCSMAARLALVPLSAAKRYGKGKLAIARLEDAWTRRTLTVGVRSGAKLSPLAKGLVEHLRQEARFTSNLRI